MIKAELGITPNSDGLVIRLTFPPLTEERRKEICKDVKKTAEDSKVAIRNIRRDAIEGFKKSLKNKEITEDDMKAAEKDIQDITDKSVAEIDKLTKKKEDEILEV